MASLEVGTPAGQTPKFDRYENLQKFSDSAICGVCCCCMTNTLTNGTLLKGRVAPPRFKNEKTPKDVGLEFKDVTFEASDSLKISAWELVKEGNTKVALVNHPLMCTRWGSKDGFDGVPVNFLPMLKHLVDNGFNVVTYDHRGQGESDGGLKQFGTLKGPTEAPCGVGAEEWKDVLGALSYIESHEVLGSNDLVLLGQCMGATAMLGAYERHPDKFEKVKAFLINMPPIGYNMTARVTSLKMRKNFADLVEQAQWDQYKMKIANPLRGIANVQCPMLMFQMKEDMYTYNPETKVNDAQQIFDACPAEDKELVYFGPGTDNPNGKNYQKRFEAYAYLNDFPEKMLEFYNKSCP
jgi:pimeloyl-ACP methyl ester carboxylesterase